MIAVGAFGAIITANLTLAYSAVQSFPGVEVKNGYIASQHFEKDRAAQERLGWRTEATYRDGVLAVAVLDREGRPAPIDDVAFRLGRPTTEADDLDPQLAPDGRGWHAEERPLQSTDAEYYPRHAGPRTHWPHHGAPEFQPWWLALFYSHEQSRAEPLLQPGPIFR